MTKILGISAFYHDSAAVLLVGEEIIAAAQEERFTRKKHTSDFPVNAIKFCLEYSGCKIEDLDTVVFYDKPFLKFERLLETYYSFAPRGLFQFIISMPVWLKEKIFIKKIILDNLAKIEKFNKKKLNILFSEHHLSHAASAFFPSGFKESAVLTIDGVGEWATATISYGHENNISILKELKFPHSVGLLYSAFTSYLGFKVNSGEYKLMGLAPYGDPESEETKRFISIIKDKLINIKNDGSVWLNQKFFAYTTGFNMVKDKEWEKLFGFSRLKDSASINQHHCNLAFAIQHVTEEIIIKMAKEAKRITGSDNLCLAGGVALNCVANGTLLRENIFKEIYIQPAAGDAGGALGAAQAIYYMYYNNPRKIPMRDIMKGSFLGPEYFDKEIEKIFKKYNAVYRKFRSYEELCKEVASLIAAGNVIGWFQGRMEYGPRALGNRSIIADPRDINMQKRLNLKVKNREGFRPFAPSVLAEDCSKFFDLPTESPYMLLVGQVNENIRRKLPENYNKFTLFEKLYFERSSIQPVTHVNFTARIQTVNKKNNKKFWQLIKTFKDLTGYGLLVNTSFNLRGEPIVCSPEDAYKCFMRTDMDYLVVNNYLLNKKEQKEYENKEKWMIKFQMD